MIAFVLSGAGNRGPLEVGALKALQEASIKPDLITATSAGAINAVYVAAHGLDQPTLAAEMQDLWSRTTTDVIYPGNLLKVAWRFINKSESLYSSDGVRGLIRSALPAGVTTFAHLKIPLYTTSTDLLNSKLYLFGEDKNTPLIPAVLASASVPLIHPPVEYNGLQLVDGGVLANVPASVAIEKGASEIYVINASYGGGKLKPADGVLEVAGRTLNTMLAQSLLSDLERADQDDTVNLYHIHLKGFESISFRDFSKTAAMVQMGYEQTKAFLVAPVARNLEPAGAGKPPVTVGGAREYIPSFMR